MTPGRRNILVPVLLAALLAAAAWNFGALSQARRSAEASAEDEAECRQIISRIESLRTRPAVAGARELAPTELTARIEAAARASQCPDGSIVRIDPEPDRQVNDAPYLEKPTRLMMQNVSLRQAVTFLHALTSDDAGLRVGGLRLSAPPGDEGSDRWRLECTLSYLVYNPRGPSPLALR